jgi:hypothetical protein
MTAPIVLSDTSDASMLLPEGTAGIDAGLTLTKIARHIAGGVVFSACETSALLDGGADVGAIAPDAASIGITGARGDHVRDGTGVVRSQEIEAAVRGAIALLGANAPDAFVLALLGTGTAFAAVRDGAPWAADRSRPSLAASIRRSRTPRRSFVPQAATAVTPT